MPQAYLSYAATMVWALVGIVVAQYDASLLATGAAVVSAGIVALAVLSEPRADRTSGISGRIARPGAT